MGPTFFLTVYFFTVLAVSFAAPSNNQINENSELLSVFTFFRHGDRSPKESYPNDVHFNKANFPMGFGHLTAAGIYRHYTIGQWLRQRYYGFLRKIYSPDEIYAIATDVDRTLMSAEANLAGLYLPIDFQVWKTDLAWQPIPVHTNNRKKDDIIVDKRTCKKWKSKHKKLKKQIYAELESKYKHLFNIVQNYTGWDTVTPDEIATLYDVMYSYKHYNPYFVPEWYLNLLEQYSKELEEIAVLTVQLATYNKKLARLRAGPFNSYLFNYFDNFIQDEIDKKLVDDDDDDDDDNDDNNDNGDDDDEVTPKFLLMVGHESSLTSIVNTLGAYNQKHVGFGFGIIFELRRNISNGNVFVRAFYKAATDVVTELNLLECGFDCAYSDLKHLAKKLTVNIDDWLDECDD